MKYIKAVLLNLIRILGYDIVRIKNYKIKPWHIAGNPLKIEFVGPSGVGKTTLFKKLLQGRGREDEWISLDEFLSTCSNRNINNTTRDESYDSLLEYKTKNVLQKKSYAIFTQLGLLSFFYQNLKKDIFLSQINKDCKVVWDDGIIHNFSTELISLAKEDERLFSAFINNLAVVYCYASEDFITKNILKRQQEKGQTRPQHIGLGSEQLNSSNQHSSKIKLETVKLLKKHSVPVLEVNMAADAAENVKKIRAFIHKL